MYLLLISTGDIYVSRLKFATRFSRKLRIYGRGVRFIINSFAVFYVFGIFPVSLFTLSIETSWANSKRPGWYNNARCCPNDKRKWRLLIAGYRNCRRGCTGRDCSTSSWPTKSRPTNPDKITGELRYNNILHRGAIIIQLISSNVFAIKVPPRL